MKSLRKTAVLLLLPTFEYLALRYLVRQYFNVRLGWMYVTDFDFVLPAPTALFVLVFGLEKKNPLLLKFQPRVFRWHVLALLVFLTLNQFFDRGVLSLSAEIWLGFWVATVIFVLLSAFFVFIKPSAFFSNPNRVLILPASLVFLAPYFSRRILLEWWPYFSESTAQSVCFVLKNTLVEPVQCLMNNHLEPRMVIHHPDMSASVGRGCGGLDSFMLWLYTSLILFGVFPKLFERRRWIFFGLFGFPMMFLLNVIRITLFFYLAVVLKNMVNEQVASDLLLALFHTHAGWILYAVGISGYIAVWVYIEDFIQKKAPVPAIPTLESASATS